MSPFLFIAYFYPGTPSPHPAHRNILLSLLSTGFWVCFSVPSAAGMLHIGCTLPRRVQTKASWKDTRKVMGSRLGGAVGLFPCFSQHPIPKTIFKTWGSLYRAQDHLHFRECERLSLPQLHKDSALSCPQTPVEETWGHRALKGTGMHSFAQISMPVLPSSPQNDCAADGSDAQRSHPADKNIPQQIPSKLTSLSVAPGLATATSAPRVPRLCPPCCHHRGVLLLVAQEGSLQPGWLRELQSYGSWPRKQSARGKGLKMGSRTHWDTGKSTHALSQ